ncbi:hypothetical protein QTP88_002188 [Uroleucon formosanum]
MHHGTGKMYRVVPQSNYFFTFNTCNSRTKKKEVAFNKEVVKDLIDIPIFLASNGLAFRGHREGWKNRNRGNFLSLVDLFSKRSPCMAAYTSKLQNSSKKSHVSFISKLRQNQLIDSIGKIILTVIQTDVKYARFFSISIDSTFDASRKEQVAFVIRYVHNKTSIISERLIAVKESSNTSGSELFTLFQLVCSERNLDWKNYLIGQSYDGAPNMRGQFEGLRSHVQKVNSSALYVWCHAHRLNLVLSRVVGCCKDAMNVFGNLVECYERHYKQLYPKQQMCQLKRAATTRMSFSVALVTVLDTFEAVVVALDEIQSKEGPDDKKIGHLAGCLSDYLLSERFLLIAHCFKKIFSILAPVNQILQKSDLDLLAAVNCIEETRESIRKLCCDTVFMDIVKEKEYFESSSSFCFTKLKKFHIRRKKLMPGETSQDDSSQDPLHNIKVNSFFYCLDIIDQSFETYFSKESLEVYKDLSLFSRKRLKDFNNTIYFNFESTSNLPKTFHENHLESIDSQDDCDSEDLENIEDENSKEKNNLSNITTVYDVFVAGGLIEVFPTLNNALHIALTLPVSSASTERKFSKLKIVKNRLRTTMTQE